MKRREGLSKDFQNRSPNRKDQQIPARTEMARNHVGTQPPWRKARGYLRLKVGHRYALAQVGLGKELAWKVRSPDQRGRSQLVPLHPAAMTRQPCRPPWSHLILETWRSQGQGQEPL